LLIGGFSLVTTILPAIESEQLLGSLNDSKLLAIATNDPLLKTFYLQYFQYEEDAPPWHSAIGRDITRRGDAATPVLLEIFDENPVGDVRTNIILDIDAFHNLKLAPFLAKIRRMLQDDAPNVSRNIFSALASFLGHHGTVDDLDLLVRASRSSRSAVVRSDIPTMIEPVKKSRMQAAHSPPLAANTITKPEAPLPLSQTETADRLNDGHSMIEGFKPNVYYVVMMLLGMTVIVVACARIWKARSKTKKK
jgi:hypothetical protein